MNYSRTSVFRFCVLIVNISHVHVGLMDKNKYMTQQNGMLKIINTVPHCCLNLTLQRTIESGIDGWIWTGMNLAETDPNLF